MLNNTKISLKCVKYNNTLLHTNYSVNFSVFFTALANAIKILFKF